MRLSIKRKLAGFLSFLMVFSIMMSGQATMLVRAEGNATITVSYKDGSAGMGQVQIKTESGWVDYTHVESGQQATAVKIVPNAGYEIDWTGVRLRVDGDDLIATDDTIKTRLSDEAGYALTAGTVYALENVEFRASGGGSVTYTVDFGTGEWTLGNVTVKSYKTGQHTLSENDTITLTGFDAGTMEVKIAERNEDGSEGFQTTLSVTDNSTSLSAKNCENLPSGTLSFSVVAKSTNNGNTECGNQGNSNPPQNEQVPGTDVEYPVKISFRGDASLGTTAYKLGKNGTWTTINGSTRISKEDLGAVSTTIYIKAQPNGNNVLDEGGTEFILDNKEQIDVNYNNLKSDDGFALSYTSGKLYDIVIEYRQNQGGGSEQGGEQTNWKLKLKIGENEYSDIQGNGRYQISAADFEKALNNDITVMTQQKNNETEVNVSGYKMSGNNFPFGDERASLQIHRIAEGSNYITVNLQSHYQDLRDTGTTVPDTVLDFYITNVTFYKIGYQGVKVEQQGPVPDMFDGLVMSDTVDISNTTQSDPQTVQMFYANNTFEVSGVNATDNVTVELADTINPAAVSISGNGVTFNSDFYDKVTFKVTKNGVIGYVKVERLGLTIQTNASNEDAIANNILHGTQNGVDWTGTEYDGKNNIVGTFYYNSNESYNDYHLIATLTYADGRVETKEVAGIGETRCVDRSLKGGDYILYSGTANEAAPVKVSVTAVKSDATTGNSFTGACFGNGAGVTATFNEEAGR